MPFTFPSATHLPYSFLRVSTGPALCKCLLRFDFRFNGFRSSVWFIICPAGVVVKKNVFICETFVRRLRSVLGFFLCDPVAEQLFWGVGTEKLPDEDGYRQRAADSGQQLTDPERTEVQAVGAQTFNEGPA